MYNAINFFNFLHIGWTLTYVPDVNWRTIATPVIIDSWRYEATTVVHHHFVESNLGGRAVKGNRFRISLERMVLKIQISLFYFVLPPE